MFLRTKFAEAVNAVVLEEAQRLHQLPPRLFFEGSYEALGIHVTPQRHLGPGPTALLRKGIVTSAAQRNVDIPQIDADIRAARATHDIKKEISAWGLVQRGTELAPVDAQLPPHHPLRSAHFEVSSRQEGIEKRIKRAQGAVASWRKNRNADSENLYLKRLEGEAERLQHDISNYKRRLDRLQKAHDNLQNLNKLKQQREEERRPVAVPQLPRHPRLPSQIASQLLEASYPKRQLPSPQRTPSREPAVILDNQIERLPPPKIDRKERDSLNFSETRRQVREIDGQTLVLMLERYKGNASAAQSPIDPEELKILLEICSEELAARQQETRGRTVPPVRPIENTAENTNVNCVRGRDDRGR